MRSRSSVYCWLSSFMVGIIFYEKPPPALGERGHITRGALVGLGFLAKWGGLLFGKSTSN